MTPTPVGMRCPECARERTKVKTVRNIAPTAVLTRALIAINVIVFLAETATGAPLGGGGGGTIWFHGALFGPAITAHNPFPFYTGTHEYWRLLTSGFLHDGLLHILFNMVFLYLMGPLLEPAIGRLNFGVVYFVSLLSGSFGALLFQPDVPTIGASTACFGVLGALIVVAYYRGISIWQSGLGLTLVINIVFSLSIAGISIGGHLGGVVGGAICGWLIVQLGERRRMPALAIAGCALVAVVSVLGAIAVAGGTGLTPNGFSL
ncbi:MAG: rhomboid family intramembrane serine protease [Solirubrobacteraceae bacterium]|jgi:membrane associated rhomboid family serine protease